MKKNTELLQYKNPYQSTIAFEEFLKSKRALNQNIKYILEAGCGAGANLHYFLNRYKDKKFEGWDYSKSQINKAKKFNKNQQINFFEKNLLKIKKKKYKFDLVYSIHTFCVFKNISKAINSVANLNSKFIAINSLFFEGYLDVLIHIRDLKDKKITDQNPDADFNIHSLPKTIEFFKKKKYELIGSKKFFPKKPIKKKLGRGSYTIKTEFNKHTTFSGPVYLPWYFLLFKKK